MITCSLFTVTLQKQTGNCKVENTVSDCCQHLLFPLSCSVKVTFQARQPIMGNERCPEERRAKPRLNFAAPTHCRRMNVSHSEPSLCKAWAGLGRENSITKNLLLRKPLSANLKHSSSSDLGSLPLCIFYPNPFSELLGILSL